MTADIDQHRHRCEVRTLLRAAQQKGRQYVRDYLDSKPVAARSERLRADLNEQRERGNNGEAGKWL